MDRRGGCRCGKVRYTVSGEPLRTGLCHCTSCRKESGSLYTAYAVWPQKPGNYIPGGDALPGSPGIHLGNFQRQGAKLGLDLQGGSQLTLQADMSNIPDDQRENALKGVVNVIERRVNAYGVAEPSIQTRGTDRVIIQGREVVVHFRAGLTLEIQHYFYGI